MSAEVFAWTMLIAGFVLVLCVLTPLVQWWGRR